MNLTELRLKQFTAFSNLHIKPSPGINVFIGTNGTGKTHILKTVYAACDISKTGLGFADKLNRVFLPNQRALGRLVRRQQGRARSEIEVFRGDLKLRISFSSNITNPDEARVTGMKEWMNSPVESVYIPAKDMLANAPKFRALYNQREIHFEEVYADILDRVYLPPKRGPVEKKRAVLLSLLQEILDGKVDKWDEEFYLKNKQGNIEFTLLAEGMRKLGLLWLLIQNETLMKGSVLFWDEPESNLNPLHYGSLMEILLELQRMGVQIFLATHDYVILKELDLRRKSNDKIFFHALYHDRGEIKCNSVTRFLDIHPNAISEAFSSLYDREVERSIGAILK